jgi:AmmeMemoRadiSam system protein A
MPSPSETDRQAILGLARRAIREAVCQDRLLHPVPTIEIFERRCGVFVSLHVKGRLRGCIGVVEAQEPLGASVVRCAAGAALQDPRFIRMRPDELADLEVEVSLLSPLQRIQPEEIEIGRHGLVVERGSRRGLLLPQVALEHGLDRERFLEETCLKAGLERGAWKEADTKIYGFSCEILSEPGQGIRENRN